MRLLPGIAPGVSITIVRDRDEALRTKLAAGEIDLAIGLLEGLAAGFFRRQIFRQGYVCVFRPDHPLARRPLTLADFIDAEHAIVTAAGSGHAQIDELIEKQGIQRNVKLRVPNYASLEHLLRSSDLIATVPEALVQPNIDPLELAHAPHPVQLPRLALNIFWHARFHRDPANRWLRDLIAVHCALPPIRRSA